MQSKGTQQKIIILFALQNTFDCPPIKQIRRGNVIAEIVAKSFTLFLPFITNFMLTLKLVLG